MSVPTDTPTTADEPTAGAALTAADVAEILAEYQHAGEQLSRALHRPDAPLADLVGMACDAIEQLHARVTAEGEDMHLSPDTRLVSRG